MVSSLCEVVLHLWSVLCVRWSCILMSFVCEVVVVLFSGEFFVCGGEMISILPKRLQL